MIDRTTMQHILRCPFHRGINDARWRTRASSAGRTRSSRNVVPSGAAAVIIATRCLDELQQPYPCRGVLMPYGV